MTRLRSAPVGLLDAIWPGEDVKESRTSRAITRAKLALKG